MKKIFITTVLAIAGLFFVATNAFALDGEVNLTNRVGEDARCWASSVLMQDQNYKVLVSCRDITYPGGSSVFYYIVWANPAAGGNPQRLGSLGLGKAEFQTRNEFTSLFVTKEKSANENSPSSNVVMQGNLKPVSILEEVGKTTATNTNTAAPSPDDETIVATPVPTTAARSGIAKYLTSGILGVLGIAGIIFIIFVVTKR